MNVLASQASRTLPNPGWTWADVRELGMGMTEGNLKEARDASQGPVTAWPTGRKYLGKILEVLCNRPARLGVSFHTR